MNPLYFSTLSSGLSVPSPLAGEGIGRLWRPLTERTPKQSFGYGAGCHTTDSIDVRFNDARPRLRKQHSQQSSRPGPPLSPALPRKGGGSAASTRRDFGSFLQSGFLT
ncbi:hypothetical protein ACVW17_001777 [Bradyrhizobium sp. USDA 4473]